MGPGLVVKAIEMNKNITINGVHHNATHAASMTKDAYITECAGLPYEGQAAAIYDECCKAVGKQPEPVKAPKAKAE